MNQTEIEEWHQYGRASAQSHLADKEYHPLPPNAPPFMERLQCHLGRYACYLRAYRLAFQEAGVPLGKLVPVTRLVPGLTYFAPLSSS